MRLRPIQNKNELKELQLKILKYVSRFCDENGIEYWLNAGTLLGAVRHKGYIPWDDDIDLGMTRTNYDKFIKSFRDETGRYSFHCVENDKQYCYPMGKVFDNNTILYELDKKSGYKISVYIDIFVHDPIPDNNALTDKLYDRRDFYKHIRTLQKAKSHKGNVIRRLCVHGFGKLLNLIPTRFLAKAIASIGRKYRYSSTLNYGSLVGDCRMVIHRDLIDKVIKMEFEGDLYSVPVGFDVLLSQVYGNYMQLPPIEKRVSIHTIEAYYIEQD